MERFQVFLGSGNDFLRTGDGDDLVRGGGGLDTLEGGGGSDTVDYSDRTETVAVTLNGAAAAGVLLAGVQEDTVAGFENVLGGSGNDTLAGDSGDNRISGNGGSDVIDGGAGNDRLAGDGGIDTLSYASAASGVTVNLTIKIAQDTLGAGLDTVGGFENLTGSAQADNLTGNELANLINGGTGADRLTGGVGRDLLHGGVDTDADIFILRSASESAPGTQRDLIYDFTSGTDRIDLHAIDPDSALAGNQAFAFSTSGAAARSVWIVDIGDHLVVRGDVTGDTTADFELQVMNTASLQAADFML